MVVLRCVIAVLLVLGSVAPTVASEDARPTPLLQALAFLPARSDVRGLDFIDWAQLKSLHGGESVGSDSPLAVRQRLMLDIARSEAAPMPFGFDRLPRWSEAWGFDSTDLEWEARVYGEVAVMRFGERWDSTSLHEALVGFDYVPEPIAGGTVYHPDPEAEVPWQLRFANMHGLDIHGRAITQPMVQVAIAEDGRTVLFSRSQDAGARLRAALEADPDAVRDGGFGQAAVGLGRPLAAALLDGRRACSERTAAVLAGPALEVAASVAPLYHYEALAAGYTRASRSAPPEGRYVFAYRGAAQAHHDLAGRRLLVEHGYAYNDDVSRYADVAFELAGAHVSGSRLIIDVDPVGGSPVHVLRGVRMSPIIFATCGPVSGVTA